MLAAEVKKKSNAPKRPSVKSLFGNVFAFTVNYFSMFLIWSCFLNACLPLCITFFVDTPGPPDPPTKGSFLNHLPTQLEVPESPVSEHQSIRATQYPQKPLH